MINGEIASEKTSPSGSQMLGYTATSAAVIRPVRRPPISLPANPHRTIPAVPRMLVQMRWAKKLLKPTADAGTRRKVNIGGKSAAGTSWWALCR